MRIGVTPDNVAAGPQAANSGPGGTLIGLYQVAQYPPAAEAEPGDCPYKGLETCDVQDAPLFFGREVLTAELVRALRDYPFLAVIGASGSGKSSVGRFDELYTSSMQTWGGKDQPAQW